MLPSKFKTKIIKRTSGRVFAIGDIHGEYDGLLRELERVNFDKKKDLLICPGDLIDRGPKNKEVINLIDEPWFEATLGNHDYMAIKAEESISRYTHWLVNGGAWISEHSVDDRNNLIEKLETLPLAIELHFNGKVYGFVHALVPDYKWSNLDGYKRKDLAHQDSPIWGREQVNNRTKSVKGVDAVFHGHTIHKEITNRGNRCYIDLKLFGYTPKKQYLIELT